MPSLNEIGRIVVHLEQRKHSVCREAVVGHRVMIVTRECHGVISLKVCKSLSSVFMEKTLIHDPKLSLYCLLYLKIINCYLLTGFQCLCMIIFLTWNRNDSREMFGVL